MSMSRSPLLHTITIAAALALSGQALPQNRGSVVPMAPDKISVMFKHGVIDLPNETTAAPPSTQWPSPYLSWRTCLVTMALSR